MALLALQMPTVQTMMEVLHIDLATKLVLAVLAGGAVGLERQIAGKPAGLRTNILICLGSALLMHLSITIPTAFGAQHIADPTRLAAQVVTGIGFIGAGTIMQSRGTITGLTSAATIWVVAAIGLTIGAGFFVEGLGATTVVMLVLAGLGKVETKLLRARRAMSATIRTKPGVALEWLRSALFAEGLTIAKADVFDHEGDRIFELQVTGPARQFEIARGALLGRDEVLNVVFE
jgi:putative Mg2+ transporter-C (MgtC) family protein